MRLCTKVSFTCLTILLLISLIYAQEEQSCAIEGSCDEGPPACLDIEEEECPSWAADGECEENPAYMLRSCTKSCNACGLCEDEEETCSDLAEAGECENNPQFMLRSCRESCDNCGGGTVDDNDFGVEQVIDEEGAEDIEKALQDMETYFQILRDDPDTTDKMHELLDHCQNKDERCAMWMALGECEENPKFMKSNCAAVCQACHLLDFETRCPLDPDAPNAWGPGDLNTFFVNMTTLAEFQQYKPNIVSRPDYVNGDTEETADYKIGPWVVTLDDFISDKEADRLIELGAVEGYERSGDVGEMNFDGTFDVDVNDDRTSTNAWCAEACYNDTLAQQVTRRIEEITNIPDENSERLQLLKYDVGQFYGTHHDHIEFDVDRQPGGRMLTVFLYLNDVEAGGGTNFPDLDITVMPKKGRALIWPSVLDEDPNESDERTEHQALKVEKGVKYGANAWIHMRDYRLAEENDCQ